MEKKTKNIKKNKKIKSHFRKLKNINSFKLPPQNNGDPIRHKEQKKKQKNKKKLK